ncbi:hypothetical protein GH714_036765 [Hevea brasiliensis]|uniref:Uncharacterized protein n=1 Tax=Hevea brasiliensis TaxID=3981 RepID=A0A6A6KKL5_HEVBR|nr:hypothetical protein GH714_036765 [Hevea brasiliensis]
MVRKLCELGWLFRKVKGYISESIDRLPAKDAGTIGHAFCAALQDELSEYFKLLAVLEAQEMNPIPLVSETFSSGNYLSLRRLSVWFAEPMVKMRSGKNSIKIHEDSSDENEDVESIEKPNLKIENASMQKQQDSTTKPLLSEINVIGASKGKNSGGTKCWSCKHCNNQFNSSYTRIHYHFFGAPPGKKAGIQCCPALMKDRVKYDKVRRIVEEAKKSGVSSSLKNSTICTKLKPIVAKANPIASAFSMMERDAVDLKVMRGLCANGIPFNVLRNPQFCEMIIAINNAPKGYKAPSYEKARTILSDECKRDVEKDLAMIKDTWYTQGVSIVSDGWSNVKYRPLINVIAANSRGAMFIEALATTIVLKSWKEWTKYGDEKMTTTGALVAETISDDELWEEVENIVAITKPLYLLIKFSDGEGPKLGEIYEKMDSMLGELKDIMTNNKYKDSYEQMKAIVVERWAKMNIPMHYLGFALTPRFYDHHYLETPASGGVPRKASNLDKEVVLSVMDAFERIAENGIEQKLLREQFVIFHIKKGIYSMPAAQIDAITIDSIDWWSTYGSETPELAEVAKKELGFGRELEDIFAEFFVVGQPVKAESLWREAKRIDKHLLDVLYTRYKFKEHCLAIKRYLLLGQGDFVQYLMDIVGPELSEPANIISSFKLAGLLESAIRSSNAQYDDRDILDRLRAKMMPHGTGDRGWDVFSLEYDARVPLDTVFTESVMGRYLRIFNFLWKVRRVEHALIGAWKMMKPNCITSHSFTKLQGAVKLQLLSTLRRCQVLWNEMNHFVTNLQYYIMFEVLEVSWSNFSNEMEVARDLDDLLAAHEQRHADRLHEGIHELQARTMASSLPSQDKNKSQSQTTDKSSEPGSWISDGRKALTQRAGEFLRNMGLLDAIAMEYTTSLEGFLPQLLVQQHVDLKFLLFRLDFTEFYSQFHPIK